MSKDLIRLTLIGSRQFLGSGKLTFAGTIRCRVAQQSAIALGSTINARAGSARHHSVTSRAKRPAFRLGSFLLFDALIVVVGADLDPPRLHRLQHLAHQIDLQKTVPEGCRRDLHVVGEVENAAKGPRRDALIKVLVLGLFDLAALDGQHILFGGDGDVLGSETRQRNLVLIVTRPFDVVRRVIVLLAGPPGGVFEQIKQAIEADGRAPKGVRS